MRSSYDQLCSLPGAGHKASVTEEDGIEPVSASNIFCQHAPQQSFVLQGALSGDAMHSSEMGF